MEKGKTVEITNTGFSHKVDKSSIPTVNILGVDIAAIDMEWLLQFTQQNIKNLSGDYMTAANVHTTVIASEDEEYRAIQNGAILAMPDGGPLSSIGRKRGAENMARTTGPSYMGKIFSISVQYGYRHFFYGSTETTLERMYANIIQNYPGISIVGMYSPPFRSLSKNEDCQIVNLINEVSPDFIWVGLGAPKQEKWMATHKGKVNGLMVGVGAGFDFFAGNIERAPEWMQKTNLEWVYRLIQDPKRLFKRYMVTNIKFIWNVIVLGK